MREFSLVGIDGNCFNIMGYVTSCLKQVKLKEDMNKYVKEAMSSDYDHLIQVSMKYLDKANNKQRILYKG